MPNADGNDRIYVARMDANGRIDEDAAIALPVTRPASRGPIDAMYPALAASPSGDGFIAAWMEISRDGLLARNVYCELDRALQPSPLVLLPRLVTEPPVLVHKEGATWIVAGDNAQELRNDGVVFGPYDVGPGASDVTLIGNSLRVAGATRLRTTIGCSCPIGWGACFSVSCEIYRDEFRLRLLSLFTRVDQTTFQFSSETKPAVEAIDDQLLLAWFHGSQSTGGNVVAARSDWAETATPRILGTFARDTGPTRPDMAADNERFLVVWRTKNGNDHDIAGAMVTLDGTSTPLTIADSSADERDPAVLALGNDRFLIAYEKFIGSERRIVARTVTFCCGRRRAVR
jgi:hypothetical protein